jgi:long-chain acyl-CoA synthetase
MTADTIPARLLSQAKQRPDAPAYCAKVDGVWRATRWKDHAQEVRRAARALLALGVGKGATVAILGYNRPEWVVMDLARRDPGGRARPRRRYNRPEWVVMDLAAMSVGAAPAGIYTTSSPEEVEYIVHHAEATVVLVENRAQWEKIDKVRARLPSVKRVVLMRGTRIDDPLAVTWEEFLSLGDAIAEDEVDRLVDSLEPTGLATLIYTSGTTGPPKGVMLSHRNLAWTARAALDLTGAGPDDVLLSYLPLSHIAEQMLTIHGGCTTGACVYFAESIEKLADDLKSVQPTVFFGVPRVWEKFHAAVRAKLAAAKGPKARLLAWARSVASRVHARKNRGEPLPGLLELQYRLAQRLVFRKLREALGLGRARMCVSGAAPLGVDVLEFFASLDLPIQEIYGQSEDTGPTSFNSPGRTRYGSVGTPIPGVEVRLADDGEILVKGPNVFLGYYKDPEATAATMEGEWLRSGDLGAFDRDGFLTITGRKKEIIITSGGKNIAPKNIEFDLKQHPLIAEAVLIGDRRPYLTALLVLDPDRLAALAREHGADPTNLDANAAPFVRSAVQKIVDTVNERYARVETVKKFHVLPRPLSIETGELTPTMKVKRAVVQKRYATEIEAMYTSSA